MHVLKLIHNVREDSPIENSEADIQRHNNIEKKILKKVMAYILVFIFQYIPLLLSDIFKLLKVILFFFIYTRIWEQKKKKNIEFFL